MFVENKKKIFYWSPCLNPVGTVKSTINSIKSVQSYGYKEFDPYLINACGEWDDYEDILLENQIKLINFRIKFFRLLPKQGFFQSRFSYFLIFIFSFLPLTKLLIQKKPDFFIAHLITSLPLTIMSMFNFKTKLILRISGLPKLNFLRKFFWKRVANKISKVTCPSLELKSSIQEKNIFENDKLFFLPDAIIDIKNYINKKKENFEIENQFDKKKLIIAAGRLTKQKNFSFLIDEFTTFCETNNDFNLIILGDGEERNKLEIQIKKKKMTDRIYLLGYTNNVYKYFKKGEIFILSSLWEEVGFVIVEAAISNLFVISSNCNNGPKEFLNYGKNGLLFESNKSDALKLALNKYLTLKNKDLLKLNLKKNSLKYTKFRHFLILKGILNI